MISVIAELERIGWAFNWAGDDEVRCLCPFHDDSSPSCSINVKKERFRCCTAGCGSKGDIITFLAGALKTTRQIIKTELSTRYDLNTDKTIDADVVERYHANIWEHQALRDELYARCITDDDIRKYRLGVHEGRITIPVKNDAQLYVNIRLYLPGAPGKDKMRNLKKRGKARLYPIDQLKYDRILLCGGEMKAVAAARVLNPFKIGCVSSTLGESNWEPKLTPRFKDKYVTICFDVDEEGVISSVVTARHISRVAKETRMLTLPLDKEKYPKGDINDFLSIKGDLLAAINEAPLFVAPKKSHLIPQKPKRVDLSKAMTAENAGRRLLITSTVSTLDMSPYIIPSRVIVKCPRDLDECALCPVYLEDPNQDYTIHPESPVILDMVARPKSTQAVPIKEELDIPKRCMSCEFDVKDYFNIEDVRVSPTLEITNRHVDRSMQPAICIGTGVELNETYEMIGRMHPHPSTQQSTLLISKYKTSQDALSSYKIKNIEDLKLFQPDEWTLESLKQRLDSIYDDFESNVTRIYGRRNIHVFADLAYHSPLFMTFDEKSIKGWVEVLIVGDSAQGKSETVMNLQKHYGLGEKVECKNASVAGLLGGLQQIGSRWFVSWGVIPTHDKRLVILEELKGASVEVISKLTDMRSSGRAEIPKIEKRRTHARTRLIALSNPRSDNPIDHYNFGIEAIRELIGSPEDIRRFDACLIVAAKEVAHTTINELQSNREAVPKRFTGKLCQNLILWGWTASSVTFENEALVLQLANKLSERFIDAIPIVDRGSMRYKLARLAAATAVRTYSINIDGGVIVRSCHVEYVFELLSTVYASKVFGYEDFAMSIRVANELTDETAIRKALINVPFPKDFTRNLLSRLFIELQDIQDWCGWDRSQAQQLLSLMVRKHALQRKGRAYCKTSAFVSFLREFQPPDRPEFMPEGEEF